MIKNKEDLKKMSIDELVDEVRNYCDVYEISEAVDFRYILREISYVCEVLVELRKRCPVSADSDEFIGITEDDMIAFAKVADLTKYASDLLYEVRENF